MRKTGEKGRLDARTLAAAAPFCAMALVTGADLLVTSQKIELLPLLSLGPALAPVPLRPTRTMLTGCLAIVLCVLVSAYDGIGFTSHSVVALVTIAGVTVAATAASAVRQNHERELVDVRAVADVAQRVLLRQVPRQVGQVRAATRYISAAASARIGGDLYDMVAVRDTARLIVADVQGKGLPAVQTAAVVLAAFRESAYDAADLAGIAAHIELSLERQVPGGRFVTAVVAEIADDIRLLNCGHPSPLLIAPAHPGETCPAGAHPAGAYSAGACLAEPAEAGLPLGLGDLTTAARKEYAVPFAAGAGMLFYTDGISEARDTAGAFYPLERCGTLLADAADPDAALDRLYADVLRHTGGHLQDDSATLYVMRP